MSDNQNPLNPKNDPILDTPLNVSTTLSDSNAVQNMPPPPVENSIPNPDSIQDNTILENDQPDASISADPMDTFQQPQTDVVVSPHTPKKYGGSKVIATIFGVIILIGGITAGVILVQRQQQISERAASGKECQQASDCILLDEPGNSGSFSAPEEIVKVAITARDVFTFQPGLSEDGCYRVKIEGRDLAWQRYGSGSECKDVSNVQVWIGQATATPTEGQTETPTSPPISESPKITAECGDVKAYDLNWNLLSQTVLNNSDPGTKVRFTVSGTTNSGSFDKAKFSVNSVSLGETTLKKPGTNEFYIEYTLATDVTDFTVSAQIHHSELGWF